MVIVRENHRKFDKTKVPRKKIELNVDFILLKLKICKLLLNHNRKKNAIYKKQFMIKFEKKLEKLLQRFFLNSYV